ncbi:unnamed protein product [Allacma fusca]|uniref:Uncharacterized protein n=1 Tax=Allacma fusca TaxID=39272 RepID=A0A8J2PIJ0_9HEXA|nr:unnamed protein product [Allacma fusca]
MSDKVEVRGADDSHVEVQARHLLDVTFKYTWKIENYFKIVEQGLSIDSPTFHVNVNGMKTEWSMALRFWTNEDGRNLTNPVVVCLNLVSSSPGIDTGESENVQVFIHTSIHTCKV